MTPFVNLIVILNCLHTWPCLCLDLYRLCGNPQGEAEGYRLHESFSQSLLKDHFQSSQQSEHKLIQVTWPIGELLSVDCDFVR